MPSKWPCEIDKHEPDKLDQQCTVIWDAVKTLDIDATEAIGVLEQVIDYLRMEEADGISTTIQNPGCDGPS